MPFVIIGHAVLSVFVVPFIVDSKALRDKFSGFRVHYSEIHIALVCIRPPFAACKHREIIFGIRLNIEKHIAAGFISLQTYGAVFKHFVSAVRRAAVGCRHNAYNTRAEKTALIPVASVFKAAVGYKVIFIGAYIGNRVINGCIVLKIRRS